MKAPKIKLIVEILASMLDRNGNTYGSVVLVDTQTGTRIAGKVDCWQNWRRFGFWCALESNEIYSTERQVPIREFNRIVKDLPYINEDQAAEALRLIYTR